MLELARTLQSGLNSPTDRFIHERLNACKDVRDGRLLRRELKIPFLEMPVPSFDAAALLREAFGLRARFVDHRSSDSAGWKSLCLHGLDEGKTLSFDRYGYTAETETPYRWTPAAAEAPRTTAWVKTLLQQGYYQEIYRVRYMWLQPGGYIRYHRDRPAGQKALGPLNVALNMPHGCHWLFKEWGSVPFREGLAFVVDISNEHGVWNDSPEDRVHIIIHGLYGPAYYAGIAQSAARSLASRNGTV